MEAYIYKADIYCCSCAGKYINVLNKANKDNDRDSDSFPQGPYSDGGGESDSPQHCGDCMVFLENSLTSDGIEYLKEMLAKKSSNGIQDELHVTWKEFYSDALDY